MRRFLSLLYWLLLALPITAASSDSAIFLANSSFEQAGDDGQPMSWESSAADGALVTLDAGTAVDGGLSLHGRLLGKPLMLRQTFDAEALRDKQLTFRGAIKTRELNGQAVIFVMVRGNGQELFTDDMRQRAVQGTTDWAHYEIVVPPLSMADEITVGVLALGDGEAWFDDLSIETITLSGEMSPAARRYLDETLDILQNRALVRERIDWPQFRAQVLAAASDAKTMEDTHGAIQYALTLLGDRHSSFRPAVEMTEQRSAKDPEPLRQIEGRLLDSQFGYLEVPGFPGGQDQQTINDFADRAQKTIGRLANQGACGWIIDLRGGAGGNMWPMLAGLGPLLQGETVGACVEPGGEVGTWWYRDGRAGIGETMRAAVQGRPIRFSAEPPPIAILNSGATASSGEAITLAFSGQANTRRFGETTAGLATANGAERLSDGSLLILTLCEMEDRNHQRFPDGVPPDVETPASDAQEQAIAWLAQTLQCQQ